MEWPQLIGLVISGGVGVKLLDVAVQGWRDAAKARGDRQDEIERAKRSRLVWMEEAHRARRLAYDLGATADQVGDPPDDPYSDRP